MKLKISDQKFDNIYDNESDLLSSHSSRKTKTILEDEIVKDDLVLGFNEDGEIYDIQVLIPHNRWQVCSEIKKSNLPEYGTKSIETPEFNDDYALIYATSNQKRTQLYLKIDPQIESKYRIVVDESITYEVSEEGVLSGIYFWNIK